MHIPMPTANSSYSTKTLLIGANLFISDFEKLTPPAPILMTWYCKSPNGFKIKLENMIISLNLLKTRWSDGTVFSESSLKGSISF
jgi:hypothetical protein